MDAENMLTPEERINAKNELLRLKLELEHGMAHTDNSSLTPEAENQWLNQVYNFEQRYKNCRKVKVYDFLGRPDFRKSDDLTGDAVSKALKRILSIMRKKSLFLDCCCAYEDAVLYKFITEELFEHEMDDMSVPGMRYHFTYEEFHPNHDYDLRRYSIDFIEGLLGRKWNPEFDTFQLSRKITFSGNVFDSSELSSIIEAFQEGRTFHIDKLEINRVALNLGQGRGEVHGYLAYFANTGRPGFLNQGNSEIGFTYEEGYWSISSFRLPGLG